jgi:hypothetical protein
MTWKNLNQARKAQTSIILLVLVVIIFAALVTFLLSFAQTVSQEKYLDLYVNNLMLSIMKTDTGYSDSNCKLMSDATACAFILPDWRCGGSGMTCLELANKSLSEYMDAFELISKNYRYLFTVTTYGFIVRTDIEQGEGMQLRFGDSELEDYKGKKRVANYVIQKTLAGTQYNLRVKLYIARK